MLYTLALSRVHTVAVLRSRRRRPSSVTEAGSPARWSRADANYIISTCNVSDMNPFFVFVREEQRGWEGLGGGGEGIPY